MYKRFFFFVVQEILKQSLTHTQPNIYSVMFAFIRHRQQAQSTCLMPLYIDHIPTSIWYLRSAFCDECNVFINPHSFLRSNFWKIFAKLTILHTETVTHREIEESDSSITNTVFHWNQNFLPIYIVHTKQMGC